MGSSIRAIAQETGVSPSTVSRALRGTGRISAKLRDKIRAAANDAGFKVHPLLSQALTLARQPQGTRYRETLAAIVEFPTEGGADYQKALLGGAEERARQLAYKLETFVLGGNPAHHRQLTRILWTRGIRGIIILPRVVNLNPRLHLEWDNFAAVEIGRRLWQPRNLHRVETSQYPKTLETVHLLKKVGYRRIGMAVEPKQNKQQNGTYYAGFLLMQQKFPTHLRLPIPGLSGKWNEASFCDWMKRYTPEVLIVHDVVEICQWLQKLKLRVPEDVSLFCVGIREDFPPGPHRDLVWTGLRADQREQGRRTVDLVSHLLERGELGLQGNPMCWQVDGHWRPGATLSRPITQFITDEGFLRAALPRSLAT